MLKISPVSYVNCSSKSNEIGKNCLSPLRCDSVSFGSTQKVVQQVGTDTVLDLMRHCTDLLKEGKVAIVKDAASLMLAGKINEAITLLAEHSLPNGAITEIAGGTKILARNWDGSPIEHVFEHVPGFKNLGLVKKIDSTEAGELFKRAFGVQPKTTVGMVGWTNVKPENIQGGTSLTKADLTKKYEEAITDFFKPVDDYFVRGLGINPNDRALTSSVSYSGVDKAIMDIGQRNGINTLTVTPFDYSIYGRSQHPFPTIITDTIPQYVDTYGKLSNNIVVTGGRDHAFKFDAGGKWLKQTDGLVMPVDVLKDYKGIVVPSTINGKIENAAALAYETFADPLPKGLVEAFRTLPSDSLKQELTHPAQQALAAAMWQQLMKAS